RTGVRAAACPAARQRVGERHAGPGWRRRSGAHRPACRRAGAARGHGRPVGRTRCRRFSSPGNGRGGRRAQAAVGAAAGVSALGAARGPDRTRGAAHRRGHGRTPARSGRGREQPPPRARPGRGARGAALALRAGDARRRRGPGHRSAGHQFRRPALSRTHPPCTPSRRPVHRPRGMVAPTPTRTRTMPDPNQPRPEADAPSPPAPSPPAAARRGRGALSLLLWLLLLVVIIATAWYFLGRGEEHAPPPAPVPIGEPVPEASRSPVSTPPASRDITARERASPSMRLPDREAQPLTRAVPAYPDAARRAGAEGTVVLQVEVDANGRPGDITVARRSGSRELDRAAEQAVRSWTFEPAMRDGKPVASTVQVPVDFHLDRR